MFIASSRSRGDKHNARGPELTHQKLQSGPLDLYVKCEGDHKFWTFSYIVINYAAGANDNDLPHSHLCFKKVIK